MFLNLKEKRNHIKTAWHVNTHHAINDVLKTIKNIKKHKGLIPYLISLFMFVNAITAAIVFLYIYGRNAIGLETQSFMFVYALFALAAIFGSYAFGKITDSIGPKKALTIAGFLWLVVLMTLYMVQSFPMFLFAGLLGGVAMGAIWTASRPMLIFLSPEKKIGEFFGFRGLIGKSSGIVGPVLFGFIVTKWNYTYGLTLLLLFFIVAFLILQKVPNIKAK